MMKNIENLEMLRDGRTDQPTDRQTKVQSRVHATKNNKEKRKGKAGRKGGKTLDIQDAIRVREQTEQNDRRIRKELGSGKKCTRTVRLD